MANDTGLSFLSELPPPGGGPVFGFDNSYARLPERFYAQLDPTPVSAPRLIKINEALARELGLDPEMLATPQAVEILAGNRIAVGSQPIALAYAGHQFGNFVPQLGDGRAILLGEVVDRDGRSGATSSSRARARRRSRAAATAARRWGRCCANTSSARRWRRSAFRPRARSRRSPPASRWCARPCCPARC